MRLCFRKLLTGPGHISKLTKDKSHEDSFFAHDTAPCPDAGWLCFPAEDVLRHAFAWVQSNPTMRQMIKLAGFEMTPEQFIAEKEHLTLVTFEPTDEPTLPPLKTDLVWVWAVLLPVCLLCVWILR
jgi:hypothetical protein